MAAVPEKNEYICKMSLTLLEKAGKELNETPETRKNCFEALRKQILQRPELKIRTDDEFLLRFLRARKFDVDNAFALVEGYFRVRLQHPEICLNLLPSTVRMVLEDGVTGVLKDRARNGCKVMLIRYGRWDPDRYDLNAIFKANLLTLLKLIQDEETQINGVYFLTDMKDVGWNHLKNVSPFYLRRSSHFLQDCFPARMKGVHIINQPEIFATIFNLMKQFSRPKLAERLHLHSGRVEELHELIDPENLPVEYGGKLPPYSNKEWMDTLLGCEAEFQEEEKYGLIENAPESNRNKQDAMETLPGTFKKLNTD